MRILFTSFNEITEVNKYTLSDARGCLLRASMIPSSGQVPLKNYRPISKLVFRPLQEVFKRFSAPKLIVVTVQAAHITGVVSYTLANCWRALNLDLSDQQQLYLPLKFLKGLQFPQVIRIVIKPV